MILYVNGDSHTAAAEAVSPAAFAEDDGYPELGRRPHPANLQASWGHRLGQQLNCEFVCDAESAGSNFRIERTTRAWLDQLPPWEEALVVIGWSTWERQEWLVDDVYYQVGSSGTDCVPDSEKQRYKEFVVGVNWAECEKLWHNRIWNLHCDLKNMQIPHVFFNSNNHFERIGTQKNWGSNYINPYDSKFTYDAILRQTGFETVNPNSWHFGKDAHCFWAEFMLQYCITNNLITEHAIPTN